MSKERVGIIVDSLNSSKQIFDYLKMSFDSKNYEITHLIVQKNSYLKNNNLIEKVKNYLKKRGIKNFFSVVSFKILMKLESIFIKRIKKFSSFFKNYSLEEFKLKIIEVEPIISNNGLIYRYSEKDLEKIKSLNLNLLIRGGSGILKGEVLNICKNGIISFHHGDNEFYRGGPPGFWEIRNKEIRTGFIIQKLTEDLDNGDVFFKGYFQTHCVYTLNLINLLEKSNPFLHYVIEDLTSKSPKIKIKNKKIKNDIIYTIPPIRVQLQYILINIKILLKKILNQLSGKAYRWGIAYQFVDNWKNPVLSKSQTIPNPPNRFLADPFLIKKNNKHYCFVEDYDYKIKKGCISVYEITKSYCKNVGIALKEDFHLSYPFLFEDGKELYMCPETHQAKDIRLYRCIEFPLKWEFVKTLIPDVSAVDTNIFYKDKKWWLMTNLSYGSIEDHGSQMHLFSNDNLLSENWESHSNNPVIFDPFFSRNAGFIKESSYHYRVFQRPGFNNYGESLGVARIEKLNSESYEEVVDFEVLPDFFNELHGTHTYNFNDGLIALDFLKISKTKN